MLMWDIYIFSQKIKQFYEVYTKAGVNYRNTIIITVSIIIMVILKIKLQLQLWTHELQLNYIGLCNYRVITHFEHKL